MNTDGTKMMRPARVRGRKKTLALRLAVAAALLIAAAGLRYPCAAWSAGPPVRAVSLLPAATEILFAVGAGDSVVGITYHSAGLPQAKGKTIIGGFFHPSADRIRALNPDVIFYAPLHDGVVSALADGGVERVRLEIDSIEGGLAAVGRIGRIMGRAPEAAKIVDTIREELSVVARKTARIPAPDRLRVLRVMSADPLMVPGDDSFQNEMIRAAGGIPPVLGKTGPAVPMTIEEWIRFNPQAVYGCDGQLNGDAPFFSQPGVGETAAIRQGKIFDFPCNLTCRAGIHSADFVSWLSARLYEETFSRDRNLVLEERVTGSRPVPLDLSYAARADILRSRLYDFSNQTLLVTFTEPMGVISTLEGPRKGVRSVGNHYAPPPLWKIAYGGGISPFRKRVLSVLETPAEETALLFTGADMDHLAAAGAAFRDLSVTALATAGVAGNAMRMGADAGGFYEPGTINILLLPGARLTDRAMSRALITATEAKTAALLDLDVRSTFSARVHRATGTGTDNIIVAEGRGLTIDSAGGHSKMGELIARAVYDAVTEAVLKQNGIFASRNVLTRLAERNISLFAVLDASSCECIENKSRALETLEQVLLIPRYAGFLETAFALSDAREKGLVKDLGAFEAECRQVAEELSGQQIDRLVDLVKDDTIPAVLRLALNGLLNGIRKWPEAESSEQNATDAVGKR